MNRALQHLREETQGSSYQDASPKQYPHSRQQCDLTIPDEWAIEFKLLRPFGDNGKEAEHWSENMLHPYPDNVSSIVVFGYEHSPPQINITITIETFEVISKQVAGAALSEWHSAEFGALIHPCISRARCSDGSFSV